MLQFFRDLALVPAMWRRAVSQERHRQKREAEMPAIRAVANHSRRRREIRQEITSRGYWDPAWGPAPEGAKELERGFSFRLR